MKKVVLVDGNNLLFRSYYATAYNGNMMKNSKGFPTNAIFGFISMIQKIISEEKPEYMAVAFDIGKNFRFEKYENYKAGRISMPDELREQFPVAKQILKALGIVFLEKEMYEADDIIGTLVNMAEKDPVYYSTIISSDKDLIQLLSLETEIKLLKAKDYIRYNPETFFTDYGIEPKKIIDLKALAGDPSDNIPGVKGIGEKTALKLLQEYGSLENIYANIEKITGKLQEKLLADKEMAFFSKELATIYLEVPLEVTFPDLKLGLTDEETLRSIYEELEFYSLLKKFAKRETPQTSFAFREIRDISELILTDESAFYLEIDSLNYHEAKVLGMAVTDKNKTYYLDGSLINPFFAQFPAQKFATYDAKKHLVILDKLGIKAPAINFDTMIAAYLLEINVKEDLAYLMLPENYEVEFYDKLKKQGFANGELLKKTICLKSKFIYETKEKYLALLEKEEMLDLFQNIELPLSVVLSDMELTGIKVDKKRLEEMKAEIKAKITIFSHEIYNLAGEEFNLNSPRQLGEILFSKLNLPHGKSNKTGYKTDAVSLTKLINIHPIIEKILEYRNLNKLSTTYLEGLEPFIRNDGKIHTIYKQTLTRTGRLSSVEPNLQNIPMRMEEGRKIRKAFLPTYDEIVSIDYSQMELRLLAHIANAQELIETFQNNEDIHTKVAADIYGVDEENVTKKMRRTAKAVIFGIIYGISGFGLGENLSISLTEAKMFIEKYYEIYPNVKKYMDKVIKDAYEQGSVRTLFNRKRTIEELKNKNYMIRTQGERMALNTPIQGTEADIIKKAMVDIYHKFKELNLKSKMILQIHDELIFDCPKEEVEIVKKVGKELMENVITLKVNLKAEANSGKDWYEAK